LLVLEGEEEDVVDLILEVRKEDMKKRLICVAPYRRKVYVDDYERIVTITIYDFLKVLSEVVSKP